MNRQEATDLIVAARLRKGMRWADIAAAVGRSPAWVTAGCLGQMSMDAEMAGTIASLLDLSDEIASALTTIPYRGSLPTAVPTDALIYRFYELISVYGTPFKELIGEEFGDGIMSAIDFKMSLEREPDPAGDRVRIVMSGKFLPYRQY